MNKSVIKTVLFVILVTLISSCTNPIKEDPVMGISGDVHDFDTEEPIEGVWFSLNDPSNDPTTYSDSLGHFEIPLLGKPPVQVIVFYGKEGYGTDSADIVIPEGQPFVRNLELALPISD